MQTKKPVIVFLIPIDELTDESIKTLNEALDQVPRVMALFEGYNPKIQRLEYVKQAVEYTYCEACKQMDLDLKDGKGN
jgi:hypothetical protein